MDIEPLRSDLRARLVTFGLMKKWEKAVRLFEVNIKHPSLHVELFEPRWRGIYSFRIDRTYRALFFIVDERVEVFQITKHYRKA